VLGLLGVGLALAAKGAWIPAKAMLAQHLLERSWERTLRSDGVTKPWSWADTWPVGRLEAPALGISQIVLEGADGSALAFAPGHHTASARVGSHGNVVLAGHRDTHFRFLRDLEPGMRLRLQSPSGAWSSYRVTHTEVVDVFETWALAPSERSLLTLVTCYPFDALEPGGPWRYVVRARAEEGEDGDLAT
jgi:sortase A